jgi:hypothetical protein
MRDYITTERTLLSFRQGDVIRLCRKTNESNGWLRGEFNGRKALFPAEYVNAISESEIKPIPKVPLYNHKIVPKNLFLFVQF